MEKDAGGGLVRALPTWPQPPRGSFCRGAPWACSGRRRAAAAAAAVAAPAVGGLGGLAGREKAEGGQLVRQERRGVDKGSVMVCSPPPLC